MLCISERSPWKNVEQKPLSEFLETGRGERKIAFSPCFPPCFVVQIGSRSGQNWLLLCVIYPDISDTLKRQSGDLGVPKKDPIQSREEAVNNGRTTGSGERQQDRVRISNHPFWMVCSRAVPGCRMPLLPGTVSESDTQPRRPPRGYRKV